MLNITWVTIQIFFVNYKLDFRYCLSDISYSKHSLIILVFSITLIFISYWKHAVKRDILKLTNEKLHTLKFACFYICFFSRICGLKLNPSACWKTPFLHISSFCKHASSFKFHFMDSLQIMWRHFAWFAESPFFCMYECKLLACKFQCGNI